MLPLRDHTADGKKVTLTEHEEPTATEVPQLFVSLKSPVATMLLTLRFAVPVFDNVMDCGELLEPTKIPPKLRLDPPPLGKLLGERLTAGATPTPAKLTLCGLPGALSLIFRTFDRVPSWVGLKVILIEQVPPAARELLHVFRV